MNYFELFEIPISLNVDPIALQKKYLTLSKKYHPDYFAHKESAEQATALNISAQLNAAFKVLKNQDETLKYILTLNGILEEEEKYTLPPAFLMEVLEINEELMDGVEEGAQQTLQSKIENLLHEIYAPVKKIMEHPKELVFTQEELLQLKDYYYKKKYLRRIQQQLNGLT